MIWEDTWKKEYAKKSSSLGCKLKIKQKSNANGVTLKENHTKNQHRGKHIYTNAGRLKVNWECLPLNKDTDLLSISKTC